MNKIIKIIIAVLGAVEIIFNIFTPLAIVLLLILNYSLNSLSIFLLLLIGILASVYRSIKFAGLIDFLE